VVRQTTRPAERHQPAPCQYEDGVEYEEEQHRLAPPQTARQRRTEDVQHHLADQDGQTRLGNSQTDYTNASFDSCSSDEGRAPDSPGSTGGDTSAFQHQQEQSHLGNAPTNNTSFDTANVDCVRADKSGDVDSKNSTGADKNSSFQYQEEQKHPHLGNAPVDQDDNSGNVNSKNCSTAEPPLETGPAETGVGADSGDEGSGVDSRESSGRDKMIYAPVKKGPPKPSKVDQPSIAVASEAGSHSSTDADRPATKKGEPSRRRRPDRATKKVEQVPSRRSRPAAKHKVNHAGPDWKPKDGMLVKIVKEGKHCGREGILTLQPYPHWKFRVDFELNGAMDSISFRKIEDLFPVATSPRNDSVASSRTKSEEANSRETSSDTEFVVPSP